MRLSLFFIGLGLALLAALPQAFCQSMFWCDSNVPAIKMANLDGSNVTVLISSGLSTPYGIAIDVQAGKLYWSDNTLGLIKRANLDGTNIQTININAAAVQGIAIDTMNAKLYWSQGSLDRDIFSSNLDGSGVQLVVNNTVTGGPEDIAIDPAGGKVYWSDSFNGFAKRANIDGTNEEIIYMGGIVAIPISGISLDIANSKVYLGDLNGNLYSVNSDGTNPQPQGSIGGGANHFAFDASNNILYFADNELQQISKVNVDGSNPVTVVDSSSAGNARGLALIVPTPTPTPVPTLRPLTPSTTIDIPPTVVVTDRSVTLFLEEFSGVLISSRALSVRRAAPEVRYDVRISRDQGGDIRRKVSKKNEVTFNHLKPGTYKGKYRATAVRKRAKSERKKAERRGKKGFDAKYRTVSRTNFSPSASFTIQ